MTFCAAMASVPNKILTLVMILKPEHVLLGMKKRGFGMGRWNGFGGKVEQGETIKECAIRETEEECGLKLFDAEEIAVMKFEFINDPQILEVHVFKSEKFEGECVETEEMRPRWFKHQEVPFDKMWPDDILWYPLLFAGKKFDAYWKFEGHDIILSHSLTERK